MTLDLGEAVQIAALQAVLRSKQAKKNPLDTEYGLRRVFRWYSKTFVTPLHEVDDLPLADVLQAYWEEHYEELQDTDLQAEREQLIEDEESLRRRQLEEDATDADVWRLSREDSKRAAVTKSLETAVQKPNDRPIFDRIRDKDPELGDGLAKEAPPEIKMQFVPDGELDLEADGFGFGLLDMPK